MPISSSYPIRRTRPDDNRADPFDDEKAIPRFLKSEILRFAQNDNWKGPFKERRRGKGHTSNVILRRQPKNLFLLTDRDDWFFLIGDYDTASGYGMTEMDRFNCRRHKRPFSENTMGEAASADPQKPEKRASRHPELN